MRGVLGVLAFLAASVCTSAAHAEPLTELIPRLIRDGGWLRAHYPGESSAERPRTLFHPEPLETPADLLGSSLHVAVVARDWQQAFNLTDGRSLLFDRLRMIRSSRMAVARFSLSGGRLLPYIETSFGHWRPDTDIVPWLRADLETASQVAFGVQAHVAPRCAVAWDVEETQIFFASAEKVPTTHVVASFAAMRAEF